MELLGSSECPTPGSAPWAAGARRSAALGCRVSVGRGPASCNAGMAARRCRGSQEAADGSPTRGPRRPGAGAWRGGRRGRLLLGALLLLLAAGGVGLQGWLLAVQLGWLRTLGATVQGLQDGLAELGEQSFRLGALEQELAELRTTQAQLRLKVQEATGVAGQMLAKLPPERLAQLLWAGAELPGQLAVLRARLACLEEGPLRLLSRGLDWAQASGSRLERFVESLATSLQKTVGSLQPLWRGVQEAQEASWRLEQRLGVVIQRTVEVEKTLGQLGQLSQALQLQLDRSQQELGEVKERVAELTSGCLVMQQLENIWPLLRELQAEKLAQEQQTRRALQSLREESADLGSRATNLETSLTAVCDLLTRVEASMAQLSNTTEDRLRALGLQLEQDMVSWVRCLRCAQGKGCPKGKDPFLSSFLQLMEQAPCTQPLERAPPSSE